MRNNSVCVATGRSPMANWPTTTTSLLRPFQSTKATEDSEREGTPPPIKRQHNNDDDAASQALTPTLLLLPPLLLPLNCLTTRLRPASFSDYLPTPTPLQPTAV